MHDWAKSHDREPSEFPEYHEKAIREAVRFLGEIEARRVFEDEAAKMRADVEKRRQENEARVHANRLRDLLEARATVERLEALLGVKP
jgi:hypothetical protein